MKDRVETLLRLHGAIENRRIKKVEAQYQENMRMVLQTQMDTLSLYTASVAHDIGTPLAAVSMGLQLLASANLTEELRQIVQDLQAAEEMMVQSQSSQRVSKVFMSGRGHQESAGASKVCTRHRPSAFHKAHQHPRAGDQVFKCSAEHVKHEQQRGIELSCCRGEGF